MLITNKSDTLAIRRDVMELSHIKKEFDETRKRYEARRKALITSIKNYMYCNKGCNDSFMFRIKGEDGEKQLMKVSKVVPTSIVWEPDKIEEVISKDEAKQVINKTYVINDMDGLITYLKSCGVSPKRFKGFIDVQKSVDTEALEQLSALGKVSEQDLSGCYTLNTKNSYIRLSIVEGEE